MKNINSNSVALFKIISGKSVEEVASIYNVSNAFVCEAMDKFFSQANEKRKYYLKSLIVLIYGVLLQSIMLLHDGQICFSLLAK